MTALTPREARERRQPALERASKIRYGIGEYLKTLGIIAVAYQEQDHLTLGYDSWQQYVDGEYGADRLRLTPEHRQKAIEELRLGGLSQRAISTTLGVSRNTVADHFDQAAPGEPPVEILGADGKTYSPARPPLVEAITGAIEAAAERAEAAADRVDSAAAPNLPTDSPVGVLRETGEVGRSSQSQVPTSPTEGPGVAAPGEEVDAPAASSPTSSDPEPAMPPAGEGEQGGPAGEVAGPPCEKCRGDLEPGAHAEGFLQCGTCDPNGSHIANEHGKCGLCADLDALVASVPEAYLPMEIATDAEGLHLRCTVCGVAVAPLRAGMPLAVPLVEANAHNCTP